MIRGPKRIFENSCVPKCIAAILIILIPAIHILGLGYFYSHYTYYVDEFNCTCSCWDTVFKGPYESGVASFKHFYFNATVNTFKIWFLVITGILLFYETIPYIITLMLQRKNRPSMTLLFATSVFSHYFVWWITINYYNDDFYDQWNHQMFFTITELISTMFVLHLANKENNVNSKKVLLISGIALLHILAGGADNFVSNVIMRQGYSNQVFRDINLMIPDILHFVVPIWLLREETRRKCTSLVLPRSYWSDSQLCKEIAFTVISIICGLILCSWL